MKTRSMLPVFLTLLIVAFGSPSFIYGDCGLITSWSQSDAPMGSDWVSYNNEPTTFCSVGWPNLSPTEAGSPRTCFTATFLCSEVWIDLHIFSYATDAEARSVYNTFRADPYMVDAANNKYGKLIEASDTFLFQMQGTYYETEHSDYGSLDLYAVHGGSLIEVHRTRQHLGPRTPPLDTMISCYRNAFAFAKALVNRKCGITDPCSGGKIPLPSGFQAFPPGDSVANPLFGTDVHEILPIGLGAEADNNNRVDYHIGLCAFEQPVDIYFGSMDPWQTGLYLLNQHQKPKFADSLTPMMQGVSEKIDLQLSGTFGDLYGTSQPISKGGHNVFLLVTPQGGDLSNAYFWSEGFQIECEGRMPVPTGQQLFIYEPKPAVVTGNDPSKIRPLAVGPYAVGGDLAIVHYDFCPFDGDVDVHLAMYCPSDDPENIYYLVDRPDFGGTPNQITEDDLFEKVSIDLGIKLPNLCWVDDAYFDWNQPSGGPFGAGIGIPSTIPQSPCFYMVAITPKGVRDKYYAWATYLDINLKQAIIDNYKSLAK